MLNHLQTTSQSTPSQSFCSLFLFSIHFHLSCLTLLVLLSKSRNSLKYYAPSVQHVTIFYEFQVPISSPSPPFYCHSQSSFWRLRSDSSFFVKSHFGLHESIKNSLHSLSTILNCQPVCQSWKILKQSVGQFRKNSIRRKIKRESRSLNPTSILLWFRIPLFIAPGLAVTGSHLTAWDITTKRTLYVLLCVMTSAELSSKNCWNKTTGPLRRWIHKLYTCVQEPIKATPNIQLHASQCRPTVHTNMNGKEWCIIDWEDQCTVTCSNPASNDKVYCCSSSDEKDVTNMQWLYNTNVICLLRAQNTSCWLFSWLL